MSKRIYVIVVALIAALAVFQVGDVPNLRNAASYSVHDTIALVLCNPAQMYTCGFGDPWNVFSGCYLAALLCIGTFVYSNSYAYPEGFRVMSILRFGSEQKYWASAMRRNWKNILFAVTVYTACVAVFCTVFQFRQGFGAVRFVPYDQFAAVYLLLWCKLLAAFSLLAVFAEAFAQRLPRAGIIGVMVVGIVLLFSVDILQQAGTFFVIGSWQMQAKAIIVFLAVQAALFVYGRLRSIRI